MINRLIYKSYSLFNKNFIFAAMFFALQNFLHSTVTVVGGTVTISYVQSEFALVGLTNINSFDQPTSNTYSTVQIQTLPGTTTAWSGISYGVNPTIPLINPPGRFLQTTNFSYDPLNFYPSLSLLDEIGIGGTTRWDVDPMLGGGVFVLGDYALRYDSGTWWLENNYSFAADAFYLGSPILSGLSSTGFTLEGNLMAGPNLVLFFGFNPLVSYGTFSITVNAIPEPSVLLQAGALGLVLLTLRLILRNKMPSHARI